ncbi:MAG: glycosyltransferase family 2 protein [Opitutae bacterium]|nr:glycosyltransferase family 2 protein [Opitutae bacterium]
MNAPIALFAYNRPQHLQQVINGLAKNKEAKSSDLIIYSDAPRIAYDESGVTDVRKLIKSVIGFRSIKTVYIKKNLGVANSIISGVTQVVNKFKTVIVLEDDTVPSPFFLQYMNESLNRFKHEDQIGSIHGYSLPLEGSLPETFLLRGADCWGWATWKRAWKTFEPNGELLMKKLKSQSLAQSFDFDGTFPYSQMLQNQIDGKIDSWAIRWHASTFLAGKYCLHPNRSLIRNIGLDASGTHCLRTKSFDVKLADKPICIARVEIKESDVAKDAIKKFYKKL